MRPQLLPLVLLAATLAGCGDQEATTPAKADNFSSGNPVTAPADYLGAVNKAQQSAVKAVDLAQVRSAIKLFQGSEDRFPASLNELVAKRYVGRLPQLPNGYAYQYNPQNGNVAVVNAAAAAAAARQYPSPVQTAPAPRPGNPKATARALATPRQ